MKNGSTVPQHRALECGLHMFEKPKNRTLLPLCLDTERYQCIPQNNYSIYKLQLVQTRYLPLAPIMQSGTQGPQEIELGKGGGERRDRVNVLREGAPW